METQEQKLTNYETLKHIKVVSELVLSMAIKLIDRTYKHDLSKMEEPELSIFTEATSRLKELTYGSKEYTDQLNAMKPALDHHYDNNSHHPEFFKNGIDGMNLIDVLEMVCDWKAATLRHADGDIRKSLEINSDRFGITPQLMSIISNTVGIL